MLESLAASIPVSSAVSYLPGQPLWRHHLLRHGVIKATIMDQPKKDSGKGGTHSDSMTKNTLRTADKMPSPTPSQPLTAEARPVQQQQRRNPPIAGELAAIASAQQGDGASFEILYNMHKRRVYSLCLRMLGNVAEAEDLTQEAFLQLHRKISTFRGDSAFSTWLHRMAVNVVLMHLRKKGLPLVSLEETLEPSQEDGPRKDFGTRDLTLSGSIDRVTLERAVEELPRAIAWFLYYMMWKATSTTKLQVCCSAPLVIANLNYIKPACACAICCVRTRTGRWTHDIQADPHATRLRRIPAATAGTVRF